MTASQPDAMPLPTDAELVELEAWARKRLKHCLAFEGLGHETNRVHYEHVIALAINRRPPVDEAAVERIAEKLFTALLGSSRFAQANQETRDWWIKQVRAALTAGRGT